MGWGFRSGRLREGGSGEPRPRAAATGTLAVRRALAPNFQSGAQERRWTLRRWTPCPSSPTHPHPCWPLSALRTRDPAMSASPAATLLPSALNEAHGRRPRGEPGMAAMPLSQPLPWACLYSAATCAQTRRVPSSESEQKFRAGRARPQHSLSLAGASTINKRADAPAPPDPPLHPRQQPARGGGRRGGAAGVIQRPAGGARCRPSPGLPGTPGACGCGFSLARPCPRSPKVQALKGLQV